MIKKYNVKYYINIYYCVYVFAIIILCSSYTINIQGHPFRSLCLYLFSMILSFVGFIITILYKKNNEQIVKQMFWCYAVLSLFWNLAICSPYSNKEHMITIIIGLIVLNVPAFCFGFLYFRFLKVKPNNIKKYCSLIGILFLFFLLCVEVIDDPPKADSMVFYRYISEAKSWDFTFDTFRKLQFGAHKSFGYSMFAMIGEYLWPNNSYGVHIVQIVMIMISVCAFYGIVGEIFPEIDKGERSLITALYAFTPIILGTTFEINLDIGLTCFTIWFVYSYIKKEYIWLIITAFLLVYSKEPGIILLFGFGLGWLIAYIYINIGKKRPVKDIFREKRIYYIFLSFLLPAISFVITFFIGDIWYQEKNSLSFTSEVTLFKWGIHLKNTVTKLKELYLMNFSWILMSIFFVGGIYLIIKKIIFISKRKYDALNRNTYRLTFVFPLMGMYILFLIFNNIYITFCSARYIMPHYFMYYLAVAYVLGIFNIGIRRVIYKCVIMLYLVETFYTIDPITLMAFENINIGSSTIITTRTFVVDSNDVLSTDIEDWINNEMINSTSYNRQFSYLNETLEKALHEIQYNDKMLIIIDPIYKEYQTNLVIGGKWDINEKYYFDKERDNIVQETDKIVINSVLWNPGILIDDTQYNHIYIFSFPYNKFHDSKEILQYFNVIDNFTVSHRGWEIYVHKVK